MQNVVKCKGLVNVNTSRKYEGKVSYNCPNHHTCNCEKTAVIASSLLANLQEIEILRNENEIYSQLFKKLHEKSKDFNENIYEVTMEMETIYEKVSQSITVVEKETVNLNNFRDEQKEKISTLLKFKQLLDDHEKEILDHEIDGYKNVLDENEKEKETWRQEINKLKEKHKLEIKMLKTKYKENKNKHADTLENKEDTINKLLTEKNHKLLEDLHTSMKSETEEKMAMRTNSDLFMDFLFNVDSEKSDYYIEELSKDGLTLETMIKKVDFWMRKEKAILKKK